MDLNLRPEKDCKFDAVSLGEKRKSGNMILSSRTLTAFYRQTDSRNGKKKQSVDKDSKIPAAVL